MLETPTASDRDQTPNLVQNGGNRAILCTARGWCFLGLPVTIAVSMVVRGAVPPGLINGIEHNPDDVLALQFLTCLLRNRRRRRTGSHNQQNAVAHIGKNAGIRYWYAWRRIKNHPIEYGSDP